MKEILRNQGACFKNNVEVQKYLESLSKNLLQDDFADLEKLINSISQIGEQINILQEDFKQVIKMMEQVQSPKTKVTFQTYINNLNICTTQLSKKFKDITTESLNILRVGVTSYKSNIKARTVNTLGLQDKLRKLKSMLVATNSAIENFITQMGNISREFHIAKRSFANVGRALFGKQMISATDVQKVNYIQRKASSLSIKIVSLIHKTDDTIKRIESMQKHSVKAELHGSNKIPTKHTKFKENVR